MKQSVAHYHVLGRLGAGGMGEVYLAEDTRLERKVALKFLSEQAAADAEVARRFLQEAKAASALNHPNVCVIYEVGADNDGRPYIAMEYLDGQTLTQWLEKQTSPAIDDVITIACQVTQALRCAEKQGIVHRDIKPDNIQVDGELRVKVLDFGLAKRTTAQEDETTSLSLRTHSGVVLGTPAYMSPEQALGRPVDHRSDIFSLGTVLYQMLTGQIPFLGKNVGEVINNVVHAQPPAIARFNYDVPQELERIIRKCMEKNPERRYQSSKELAVDLLALQQASSASVTHSQGISSLDVAATEPSPPAAPPAEEVRGSDVFISYAAIDDHPLSAQRHGWISEFHRNLEIRIEQLSGERVKIWRHLNRDSEAGESDSVLPYLRDVKTMISVVSPPYVKSQSCCQQMESFWEVTQSGNRKLKSPSRIFKVVKHPVPAAEVPDQLSAVFTELLDFEFYDIDEQTGRVREFNASFGETEMQRYHERVYDLAQSIVDVLRQGSQEQQKGDDAAVEGSGLTIYVATTTSDQQEARNQLCRELQAHGHHVLPDRPLPLTKQELAHDLEHYLQQSDLSVHLVGAHYGVIPEGAEISLLEHQNVVASGFSQQHNLPRVIWLPRDLVCDEPRQNEWLERLRRDPDQHAGAEILEDTVEGLKQLTLQKLVQPQTPPPPAADGAATSPIRIYLICDREDLPNIEEIEDYLFEQGFEISLPDFDAAESEAAEVHRQNMIDCDAVLIYYGAARHAWVDIKLRGLLKAAGYGRTRDLAAQAVYVAPPFDRRKERFRSHTADVIRASDVFQPQVLQPLVERLKQTPCQ